MIFGISALLFLCGHHKIKHWVKSYFYAHNLKTSSCCILENSFWYFSTMKVHIRVQFEARQPSAVHRCSEGVELMFVGCRREQCQWQSWIQSDCKPATSSWAVQGNFWQACQATEPLILLLIQSCILELYLYLPSCVVQSSGEASPVIRVRIQH